MHTRRWQRGRDPRRKRRPGGLCCALSGAPELHLGSPLSPFTEPMPRCSSLTPSSSTRFSLCPVLTPSCPSQSPGLQLQEEEAGELCASVIHPLRSQSVCQPASPTHSGLGPASLGSRLHKALGAAVVSEKKENGSPWTQKA